ncbi:hypothetical protein AAVH_37974, partial [Aphelenchoides avenae]
CAEDGGGSSALSELLRRRLQGPLAEHIPRDDAQPERTASSWALLYSLRRHQSGSRHWRHQRVRHHQVSHLRRNHPRLSPSFISELIEAVKSGRIARSDPPRQILEPNYASRTWDISTLSQYHSRTDPSPFPISITYFIDHNITIEHSYCGQPYIQLLV